MRINGIGVTNPFKGRVYQNYYKTVNQISTCPYSTQESLIGNINTLKHRLEEQTPDDKTYIVDFDYQSERESKYDPKYHFATISIKDENGNVISNKFSLGKSGGSNKNDRTELANGEEIWQNGFREITEKAIDSSFEAADNEELNIEKACEERHWDAEQYTPLIEEIAEKIEDRGKVSMNKAEIAASILTVTKDCPDEILESIIGNINTLTKRLDEESAKQKSYRISVSNAFQEYSSRGFYTSHKDRYLRVRVSAQNSTHYSEYQEEILNVKSYENFKTYCITDSEKIYQDTFKPLTNKLLWDSHHYLPLADDYGKSSILDNLY